MAVPELGDARGAAGLADPACEAAVAAVGDVAERRAAGEVVTDEEVLDRHPGIRAVLADELSALRTMHRTMLAARKGAGWTPDAAGVATVEPDGRGAPVFLPAARGYIVLSEIARGAQASVFLAVHQLTGRRVALKVVRGGGMASSAERHRFGREADILAAVDHPNVVKIIDRGQAEDGSLFIAMDHVDGPALDDWVSEARTRSASYDREVAAAFARVATAVGEVHRLGVVHRDLKPSNVRFDRWDQPRVLDFGLAHVNAAGWGDADGGQRFATRDGQIIGSLPWASPEQAAGQTAAVDARSDVYALGVMLYHALSGTFPYPVDSTIREVIENICVRPPAVPIRLAYRSAERVDPGLEAVTLKAIRKRPDERYETMAAFADDLDAWLAGRSPAALVETRAHRRRRRRRRWAAGGMCLSVLAAGGAALRIASPPRAAVVLPRPSFRNSLGMTLVRLGPGQIVVGSEFTEADRDASERPFTATVGRPFWIGTEEVTRRQYRDIAGSLPAEAQPELGDDVPVTSVSWPDAVAFCEKLSARERRRYRLPSEIEWEFACRAESRSAYGGTGRLDDGGWYLGNSGGQPHPTSRKRPNTYGLFDMHGNAEEWCADAYGPRHPSERSVDPGIPPDLQRRVARGGSAADVAARCRSAARNDRPPLSPGPFTGFRVAAEDVNPPATARNPSKIFWRESGARLLFSPPGNGTGEGWSWQKLRDSAREPLRDTARTAMLPARMPKSSS